MATSSCMCASHAFLFCMHVCLARVSFLHACLPYTCYFSCMHVFLTHVLFHACTSTLHVFLFLHAHLPYTCCFSSKLGLRPTKKYMDIVVYKSKRTFLITFQILKDLTINTNIHHRIQYMYTRSMIILIRNGEYEATVERGACFLPTIGIVTPDRFTSGHPRARP
jgi:hypothetical protein